MRGVSTTRGTAMRATTTGTTTTPTTISSQVRSRLIAPRGSALLDRRQPEAARPDRPHERPVFLELLRRRVRAIDDGARRVVHDPVEHLAGQVHRDEVLTGLLPRLGDFRAPDVDARHAIGASLLTESVTLRLQRGEHLGRQRVPDTAEIAAIDRILHGQEGGACGGSEAVRIEAAVHLADVVDATPEIRAARRDLHGRAIGGAAGRRAGIGRLRALAPPAHEHDEDCDAAPDQQQVEKADPTKSVAETAEQEAAKQSAEHESAKRAHEAAER